MNKEFNFSGASYDAESVMTVNGLHCVFNMPPAVINIPHYEIRVTLLNEEKCWHDDAYGRKKFARMEDATAWVNNLMATGKYKDAEIVLGEEQTYGLPPGAPRKAFKVDEYDCPTNWMHGSGLASSYFVPIEANKGMWLDFNRNAAHTHDIAVLISVQGVNPLDGQSMVDGAMNLRQYKTKCPVHDVEFGGDRYCNRCGYKWVPQNYLTTTGTPSGLLWLDGFLAADGVVRQYYFTEEEAKGVAHQIIGSDKKVYSIGIAFYLSKKPKPVREVVYRSAPSSGWYGSKSPIIGSGGQHCNSTKGINNRIRKRTLGGGSGSGSDFAGFKSCEVTCSMSDSSGSMSQQASGSANLDGFGFESLESVKTLDIAAGAKINQKVYADPNDLDFWCEQPAGMLYINYTPSEEVVKILKRGKKDLSKNGEGFLAGLNR